MSSSQDGRSSHDSPGAAPRGILKGGRSGSPSSHHSLTHTSTTTARASPPDTLILDAALLNSKRPGGRANVSANAEAVGSYMDKLQSYLEVISNEYMVYLQIFMDNAMYNA